MRQPNELNPERLRELLMRMEPRGIRSYLTVPEEGRRYRVGASVPLVGAFVQLVNGLWVPDGARTERGPLDYTLTYVTFSEIADGLRIPLEWLIWALGRLPLKNSLLQVAATMAAIRQPNDENPARVHDQASLQFFTEPVKSRLANRLSQNSTIHAPQLLMVLAKLILAHCPDDVPLDQVCTTSLSHLLMVLADNLDKSVPNDTEQTMPLLSEFTLELVANNNFNSRSRFQPRSGLKITV